LVWVDLVGDGIQMRKRAVSVSMCRYLEGRWGDPTPVFEVPSKQVIDFSANERLVALVNDAGQVIVFDRSSPKPTPMILSMPGLRYEKRITGAHVHEIRVGETLNGIARRYSVSVRDLVGLNDLENPDLIKAHMSLILPDSATINRCVNVHEIQPGETLNSIAKRYGVSVEALVILNDIEDPDRIICHTPLVLPNSAKTNGRVIIHEMDERSLSSVARNHGVLLESIVLLNNIKDPDRIHHRTPLILPHNAETDGCENCTIKVEQQNQVSEVVR
ncbi:MAG: LysM peptidoglycan-binding domain-containing protein, partial [Spirochaetales bacterium]|nr:LysM peptidoglycan-binding domain-containing protein [Spirochaetales bacterium]